MRLVNLKVLLLSITLVVISSLQGQNIDGKKYVNIIEYSLDNGLHIILNRDTTSPIVNVGVMYHVGGKNELPGKTGIAHLTEHVLFHGTKNIKQGEFDKIIRFAGGYSNASTTSDRTYYYITLPSNQLKFGIWMEAERMLHPEITKEGLEREIEVVKEELRVRYKKTPLGMVEMDMMAFEFGNHPYRLPLIGTEEDLNSITTNDIQEFLAKFYLPNNAVLSISGDFEINEVKEIIESYFGNIPKGKNHPKPFYDRVLEKNNKFSDNNGNPKERIKYLELQRITSPHVIISYFATPENTKDAEILKFLIHLMNDEKNGEVRNIFIDKKLGISKLSLTPEFYEQAGMVWIRTSYSDSIEISKVLNHIDKVFNNISINGIDQSRIDIFKKKYEKDFTDVFFSPPTMSEISSYDYLTKSNSKSFLNILSTIYSITNEDIKSVTKKYLNPNNRSIIVYKNKKEHTEQQQIAANINPTSNAANTNQTSNAANTNQTSNAAYTLSQKTIGKPENNRDIDNNTGISLIKERESIIKQSYKKDKVDRSIIPDATAPKPIRIAESKTFVSKNQSTLFIVRKREYPKFKYSFLFNLPSLDKENESEKRAVLSKILSYYVQDTLIVKQLKKYEEQGVIISTSLNSYSASGMSKDIDLFFKFISPLFSDSFISDKLFDKAKTEYLEEIREKAKKSLKSSTVNKKEAFNILKDSLEFYKNPNKNVITTPDTSSIKILKKNDIKQYFNKYFCPQNTFSMITGDFDNTKIDSLFSKYLKNWKKGTKYIEKNNLNIYTKNFPTKRKIYVINKPGVVQSSISIDWPLGDAYPYSNIEPVLKVLNQVFGESYSSYLNDNLRVDKGLCYGAKCFLNINVIGGNCLAATNVRTDQTAYALENMLYEMLRIRNQLVDDKTLTMAKNGLIGDFALSMSSVNSPSILGFGMVKEQFNLPDDYLQNYPSKIYKVTAQQIREAAQKYIKPYECIIYITGNAAELKGKLEKFGEVEYWENNQKTN